MQQVDLDVADLTGGTPIGPLQGGGLLAVLDGFHDLATAFAAPLAAPDHHTPMSRFGRAFGAGTRKDISMGETIATMCNVNPQPGSRLADDTNAFELRGCDHFALTTHDIGLMERFIREVLGGVPFYYAGFDETDRQMRRPPHIFIRVGSVLVQCTEEPGEMNTAPGDQRVAPHWAFATSSTGLDRNMERLEAAGIPVAGPYRHRGVDCVSIYFRSPEGHKLEIATWEPYPEERARLLGAPGVGLIDWNRLVHAWPGR